jgi:carboxypeptidase T
MRTIKLISFSLILFLSIPGVAQVTYSKVKIRLPESQEQRIQMFSLLDAEHFSSEDDGIIAEISAHSRQQLKSAGYSFEILIDDVTRHFVEQSKKFFKQGATANRSAFDPAAKTVRDFIETPSFFSTNGLPPGGMGGFYTLAEMNTKMNELVTAFPSLIQKFSIGTSIEGRTIWCIKISDNAATDETDEPEILYLGLQHAREAITGTSLIFFAQYLLQNYTGNAAVKELVDNREIFIVPCVNPDGYYFNEQNNPSGGGMQRKNRRNVGSDITGQKGVDLNRNYGTDWADCAGASTACGSSSTSNETYWGANAFSEPETQAIRNLCYSRNFVAAFDQHCSGPYYSLPFGRRSYHTMNSADRNFYTTVPALMGKYNGHRAGDSYATVQYEVAGGAKDWWLLGDIESYPGEPNKKGKVYGMTGEAGGGGFWAPSSQIIELCKNLCFQNMQLAYAAGSYVDIQDISDIALNTRTPSIGFRIQRIGLGDHPVTVSLVPLQNISTVGGPVTIATLPQYGDVQTGAIPVTLPSSLGNGQRIKFAWKVETGGITLYDTVTKIYNPVAVFSDEMETGLVTANWNVSNGWNYTNTFAYNGSRSLTESPGGNYTASTTRIAAIKNAIDLSNATAAYISFLTRHRAENFRDLLRIQVSTNSTDGMNGSWTNLPGKNTVQETNTTNQGRLGGQPALTGIRESWTREVIEIPSDYYNSNQVWIRLEFTSDGTSGNDFENDLDDGFYIDDFKIVKSTVPLMTLPVKFISFTGNLLPDETVALRWEAETDADHDHFEIERSADGINFESMGIIVNRPPYRVLDERPFTGNNFYRIKQSDKDGSVMYSHTVNIYVSPKAMLVSIYPNPVNDVLYIRWNYPGMGKYSISLNDITGRSVIRKEILSASAGTTIQIDLHSQSAQLYLLVIRDSKNKIIATQRIVKN